MSEMSIREQDHRMRLAGVLDSELTKRDRSIEHALSWDEIQDIAEAVAKADREATAADWVDLQKRDPAIAAYLHECTHALEDYTRAELKALGNVKTALALARSEGRAEGIEAVLLELKTIWHGATGSGNPDYTTGWRAAIEFAQGRIRAQSRIRALSGEMTK